MNYTFKAFVDGTYDYDAASKTHNGLWLHGEKADIGGGTISIADIDVLKEHPDEDTVTVSGLHQDTFEYFIMTYGKQLRAIRFFKNKCVEDWSLLGTLPQLEYVYYFFNQRIKSLWDMSGNTSLVGLCIKDFSRITSIEGIQTAPNLSEFIIGNAIWPTMVLDSLTPLAGTNVEKLQFFGKDINNHDLSFLSEMKRLKCFDFPSNLFTTEQVAWIAANLPQIEGHSVKAKIDCALYDSSDKCVPGAIIVGKRKPSLVVRGNEKRIGRYVSKYAELKEKYRNVPYREAFDD